MRTKPALIATATLAAIAVVAIAVTRPAHHRAAPAMAAPHGVLGVAYAAEAAAAGISTRAVAGLGPVLVNASGSRTLYVFLPDARTQVECVAICTTFWVPLKLAPGQKSALTARGAKRSLIGSVPGAGGRVVTYAGWPLYTFVADQKPGEDNGTDSKAFGASWYPLHSNGKKAGH